MPTLPFFADARDAAALLDWLNRDPEIAFIVPDGPPDPQAAYVHRVRALLGAATEAATLYPRFTLADAGQPRRWKAVRAVERLPDGKHSLWHVPSGPLPISADDPWAGFEQSSGADPTLPDFGIAHPAEIYLELWTRQRPYSIAERTALPALLHYWTGDAPLLVLSVFGWIGDYFRPAPLAAWRWWERLQTWMAGHASLIGSCEAGNGSAESSDCWAFPSALEKLRSGMACETRGWELSPRTLKPTDGRPWA